MLVGFYKDSDNGYEFLSNGCGCCADTYYLEKDKEKIIEELKDMYKTLNEMCGIVGIEMKDLCV